MHCCVFSIPRVSTPFRFVFTQQSHGRQEGSCLPSEAESVGSWVAGYHPGEGQCNSGPVFLLHPSFPATPHSIPCITLFSSCSRFTNVICVASIMNRTVRNYLQNWTNFNTYMYQVGDSTLSKYPDINGEESPTAQAALCAELRVSLAEYWFQHWCLFSRTDIWPSLHLFLLPSHLSFPLLWLSRAGRHNYTLQWWNLHICLEWGCLMSLFLCFHISLLKKIPEITVCHALMRMLILSLTALHAGLNISFITSHVRNRLHWCTEAPLCFSFHPTEEVFPSHPTLFPPLCTRF